MRLTLFGDKAWACYYVFVQRPAQKNSAAEILTGFRCQKFSAAEILTGFRCQKFSAIKFATGFPEIESRFSSPKFFGPTFLLQTNQTETAYSYARLRRKIWKTHEDPACHQGINQDPNLKVPLKLRRIPTIGSKSRRVFQRTSHDSMGEWAPKM